MGWQCEIMVTVNVRLAVSTQNASARRWRVTGSWPVGTLMLYAGMLLILELQLSFQCSGPGSAGRYSDREEGFRVRRGGGQHDDPRTVGHEFQSEPESADHLGPVLLHFLLAATEGCVDDFRLTGQEERQRNEQAGTEEAEKRRFPSPSSAWADAKRVVWLVHLQEGQEERGVGL